MQQEWFRTEKYAGPYVESASLINNCGRNTESMNGQWNYLLDQYGAFFREDWWKLQRHKEHQEKGGVCYDYSLNDSPTIHVPSTINTELQECTYYEGTVVYTRTFSYTPGGKGERAFLYFHGAQYRTGVSLNCVWLGKHRGGSTPFCFEVTDILSADNRLMIGVDCRRAPEQVPTQLTDWFAYGGLYRGVELIRVPASFIREWFVRLAPGSDMHQIAVDIEIDNPVGAEPVRIAIEELDLEVELTVDAHGRATTLLDAHPKLWSPENPRLYHVRICYGDDEVLDEIGFREIRVEGREILLNGKPIWLRGICCHEDSVTNGKSLTRAEVEENMHLAKELNCNFMRLAHYPHQQYSAQLADRLGLLLWEEIPVYWDIRFDSDETYADAENQLLELIRRDRNRASVIVWSVGNENEDTDDRLAFLTRLVGAARAIDDTRLVSAACLVTEDLKFKDRLVDHLDVVGFNEYLGWYKPVETIAEILRMESDGLPPVPVMITETGAAALSGHHGPDDQMWTEEFQERLYREQTKYIPQLQSVRGMSPWILHDFRAPLRQNLFQRGYNRKGLLSEDKTHRKMAFYVLQAFYGEMMRTDVRPTNPSEGQPMPSE